MIPPNEIGNTGQTGLVVSSKKFAGPVGHLAGRHCIYEPRETSSSRRLRTETSTVTTGRSLETSVSHMARRGLGRKEEGSKLAFQKLKKG